MEFVFETTYDLRGLIVMNRVMRKTVRKKQSRRTRIYGCFVIVWAAFLSVLSILRENYFNALTIIMICTALTMLIVMIWEDQINARSSRKRLMGGCNTARTVFSEENFVSESEMGTSEWRYEKIRLVAETEDYFVFVIDEHFAQLYAKSQLSGGTPEEFAQFIEKKIGMPVQSVK